MEELKRYIICRLREDSEYTNPDVLASEGSEQSLTV